MLVNSDGSWPSILGTVDYEANFRLDRATGKNTHFSRNVRALLAEHLQNVCYWSFFRWHIDDNAHCATFIVAHY